MSIDPEDLKEFERLDRESLEELTTANQGWSFFDIRDGGLAENFVPDFTADYQDWISGFLGSIFSLRILTKNGEHARLTIFNLCGWDGSLQLFDAGCWRSGCECRHGVLRT